MSAVMALDVAHELLDGQYVTVNLNVDLDQLAPAVRRWVTQLITAATVPFPDVAHDPEGAGSVPASPPVSADGPLAVEPTPSPSDPPPAPAPRPADRVARTVGSRRYQEGTAGHFTLAALAEHGPIDDEHGHATAALQRLVGHGITDGAIRQAITRLRSDGLILTEVDDSKRRTFRIVITDAGRKALGADLPPTRSTSAGTTGMCLGGSHRLCHAASCTCTCHTKRAA